MPRVAAACAATLALSTAPALAHPPGACLSVAERCETWFATFDEPATMPSARSDQFTTTVLMNMTTVFIVVRSVAFPPASPEDATAAAVVVAYDRVSGAVRWTARGTNTGTGNGIPATGRKVQISGTAIFRFENGKIAEEWVAGDMLSLQRQLGLR